MRPEATIEMDGTNVINHRAIFKFQSAHVRPYTIRQFQHMRAGMQRMKAAYGNNKKSPPSDLFNFAFAMLVGVNSAASSYAKIFEEDAGLRKVRDLVKQATDPKTPTYGQKEFMDFIGRIQSAIQEFAPTYREKMDVIWPLFSPHMADKVLNFRPAEGAPVPTACPPLVMILDTVSDVNDIPRDAVVVRPVKRRKVVPSE